MTSPLYCDMPRVLTCYGELFQNRVNRPQRNAMLEHPPCPADPVCALSWAPCKKGRWVAAAPCRYDEGMFTVFFFNRCSRHTPLCPPCGPGSANLRLFWLFHVRSIDFRGKWLISSALSARCPTIVVLMVAYIPRNPLGSA